MPLIQVKLIEGVFDAAEKETIIEKLTDAMVSVEGEAMRPVTWVTLEEVTSGEWGIAGKALHQATSSVCAPPRRSDGGALGRTPGALASRPWRTIGSSASG